MDCTYHENGDGLFVCETCGDTRTKRVRRRCNSRNARGIGDSIARGLAAVGIRKKPGCGCPDRQAWFNRLLPYSAEVWKARLHDVGHAIADIPRWLIPARRPPRILQICRSLDTACGVANFARNLHDAAACAGATIETVPSLPSSLATCDVALIQHENAFYLRRPHELKETAHQLAAAGLRRVLFVHSPCNLDDLADAYVAMSDGMLTTDRPVLTMHHPANVAPLVARQLLRERLGLDRFRLLIGSHGFVTPPRRFADFVRRLAPIARELDGAIFLAVATHAAPSPAALHAVDQLRREAKRWPNVLVAHGFQPAEHVNAIMQACDLAWCWTNVASRPYASGVASDLYGAGTRLIVADKQQHAAVLGRPNVVAGPADIDAFLETVVAEMRRDDFPRHDPAPLSWQHATPALLDFLRR